MTDASRPTPAVPLVQDLCPKWAALLIEQLCALEVRLGNVRPAGDWKQANLEDVMKRMAEGADAFDDSVVEALFRKIATGLVGDGFSEAEIAAFVNARIPSGRLPYCNAAEVREAARTPDVD